MRRRLAISIAFLLAATLCVGVARGELSQRGNLRVAFDGGFSPHSLPRDRLAPISVHLSGSIRTVDGSRPPQLRRMVVEINREGRLFTRGLPACSAGLLQATTTQAARERCGGALVGRGSFVANVDFPGVSTFPAHGEMLAFNGRANGRPALLMHFYVSTPVQATLVIPFKISHRPKGQFGTVLSARIPVLAGDQGYITDIGLTIGRQFNFDGSSHSLLSAACAAPAGFHGAAFAFAKGSFYFANGQKLTSALTRECRVR
jgi:hypothetical protein